MKNTIVIFISLCIMLCAGGCKNNVENNYTSNEIPSSAAEESKETSKYHESSETEKNNLNNNDSSNDNTLPNSENTEALLLRNVPEIIRTKPNFMQYSENPVYLSEISRVILVADGDLNSDGYSDLAVVVEFMEQDKDSLGYAENGFGFGARHIYILLGNSDGSYTITNKNEDLILKHCEGGIFGDPLQKVSIQNGILNVNHYGGSSYRWGHETCFSYSEGQLILTEATFISHSVHASGVNKTIYDFANSTIERYFCEHDEAKGILLFSEKRTYDKLFFDNATHGEIRNLESINFLPYIDCTQIGRFDKPYDLKVSTSQVLDMVMEEHYPDFEKVYIPWSKENKNNYFDLLGYEVPDYYYKGVDGMLAYYHLDIEGNNGEILGLTHRAYFVSFEDENWDFFRIEDK